MRTRYDRNSLAQHHAEGNSSYAMGISARYADHDNIPAPVFERFIVIDVIFDPAIIDQTKLDYWIHDLGVMNVSAASVAPRNAIIARRAMSNTSAATEKVMVLYPFFPPHLSLPVKPGEHVWGMFPNIDAKTNEIGYWMCRIVGPNFIEDQNFTHSDRAMDISFHPSLVSKHDGSVKPVYEYRNGAVQEESGQRFSVADTISLPGDENAYGDLLSVADAAKLLKFEPVPRYKKRPSDFTLEGSNNALIVLGTNREGILASYTNDPQKGQIPAFPPNDTGGKTGLIDIVVGRGQTQATRGNIALNATTNESELGKSLDELVPNEGDPDYVNDRTRLILLQTGDIDVQFKLDSFNSADMNLPPTKVGAAALKSDKIRLIARSDIEILVTGNSLDQDNNMVESTNKDDFAAILIKANGDIVFKPSKLGVVKLGGDDANLAVLCTSVNNVGVGGQVTASPIIDTAAGSQGGSGGANGTFATKILLK